ncbi:MAG: glycosyltransferase family 39 protein, partial [Chitinophagaceae bacterium]|nr:glycosyltransferase family 39 protein [Chitinophagaceae bacterium]
GDFWNLYYRGDGVFNEHPPLMFGVQAIFFKIFGEQYYTEKIFSFLVWMITVFAVKRLWNVIRQPDDKKYNYVLPLMLWGFIQTVIWSYTNNILDTFMGLIDLLAIITVLSALLSNKNVNGKLALAGLITFCAIFTKGPPGAFPIAAPILYHIIYTKGLKGIGKGIAQSMIMLAVVVGVYVILMQYEPAAASINRYMGQQLSAALEGKREITGGSLGRFAIFSFLLVEMIPAFVISILILVLNKIARYKSVITTDKRMIWLILLIALSASAPIMLSLKQRSFYLIPSIPYYVLALSLFIYPYFINVTDRWRISGKKLNRFHLAVFAAFVSLAFYLGNKAGQPGRDKEMIHEIKQLTAIIPEDTKVGMCDEIQKEFGFLAYLQRYNKIEVAHVYYEAEYALIYNNVCKDEFRNMLVRFGFKQVEENLAQYEIYKRKYPLNFDFKLLNPAFPIADKSQPSESQPHSQPDQE